MADQPTTIEAAVLTLWRETLHLGCVSLVDSFLGLGGDSLAAADIAAKIRAQFHVDLPLDAVFGTAEELVALIEAAVLQNAGERSGVTHA